jgi:hypothetical protein
VARLAAPTAQTITTKGFSYNCYCLQHSRSTRTTFPHYTRPTTFRDSKCRTLCDKCAMLCLQALGPPTGKHQVQLLPAQPAANSQVDSPTTQWASCRTALSKQQQKTCSGASTKTEASKDNLSRPSPTQQRQEQRGQRQCGGTTEGAGPQHTTALRSKGSSSSTCRWRSGTDGS